MIKRSLAMRAMLVLTPILSLTILSTWSRASTGTCGGQSTTIPFTDVISTNVFFCAIAEAYFTGLTNGTTPTTYGPSENVPREQMAAFITRTLDQSLRRGNRRAALGQWWKPDLENIYGETGLGGGLPIAVASDGADLWVANRTGGTVSRVRASDGKLLETWTGATSANGVLVARGRVFVIGSLTPGRLYVINPSQPPGPVTLLSGSLGAAPYGIAFDGQRIWTANNFGNSVSIFDLLTGGPVSTTGFTAPHGIAYDGANMWVCDSSGGGAIKKLDINGFTLQTVPVGLNPLDLTFDGTNIWVANSSSDSVTVVRVRDGVVLATLSGNGLNGPADVAFDGERILVTNLDGDSVSLWKAADLTPLGSIDTFNGDMPYGVCSDGINFWVTLSGINVLKRF